MCWWNRREKIRNGFSVFGRETARTAGGSAETERNGMQTGLHCHRLNAAWRAGGFFVKWSSDNTGRGPVEAGGIYGKAKENIQRSIYVRQILCG